MPNEIRNEIKSNSIMCCDVLDGLSRIKSESIHLVLCSPPYNVGIKYDIHHDLLPHQEYLDWMKTVWRECHRVLVCGGRICINIDATMNLEDDPSQRRERVHPLHVDFTDQIRDLGYLYRGEIIWCKQNASGSDTCWGSYCSPSNPHIRRNTEYIIVASKDSLTLHGDPMLSDLTKEEFHAWTLSEWRIPPETRKHIHPVRFPRELVRRCIKLFSFVGNTVLDVFNGSGTTTTTAIELGRNTIGIDISPTYCEIATQDAIRAETELNISGGYQYMPSPIHVQDEKQKKSSRKQHHDLFV